MNGGSPFLAEIRRPTSSSSPGGRVSASMSVTNPYRYSRLASASIVFAVDCVVLSMWLLVLLPVWRRRRAHRSRGRALGRAVEPTAERPPPGGRAPGGRVPRGAPDHKPTPAGDAPRDIAAPPPAPGLGPRAGRLTRPAPRASAGVVEDDAAGVA